MVDGTTYELEGVYHFVAERNDQLNIDFTEEVDLSALAGREFVINGVTFAVNDRSGHHRTRGNSLIWAAPQWTASMGWTVDSTIWVGLKAPPSSTAQAAPAAAVTRTGERPVHGPFEVRFTFSEDVTGFEASDVAAENAAVVEDSFTAGDARTWTARIAPVASGTVAVSVPADAAQAGQTGNTASEALTVEADLSVPAVTVTSTAPAPVAGPFSVRVTFSKPVTGFAMDDLTVEGGTATGLVSPIGETWHDVLITPSTGTAEVAVTVPAGVVEDLAGRPNGASETLRIAVAGAGFTARFEELPESHDGASAFSFELHFSETPEDLSFRTVASDLLDVAGAEVTGARRHTPGSNQGWIVSVRPTQDGDVTITLPARACGESNAVCFAGRPLAAAVSATVPGATATVPRAPFTASFSDVPAEHDGAGAFTLTLVFGEEPTGLSYRTVRDSLFTVTGGAVTTARRLAPPSNRRWELTVAPAAHGAVTITLPAGAVETQDGRRLDGTTAATVAGPVGIAVADARVDENDGAVLAFVVTLSRAASGTLTVDYATADGTAHAGVDYTAASGTLTFQAGASSQTVEVAVLDDAHDEGEETLTLTLSNASSGRLTVRPDGGGACGRARGGPAAGAARAGVRGPGRRPGIAARHGARRRARRPLPARRRGRPAGQPGPPRSAVRHAGRRVRRTEASPSGRLLRPDSADESPARASVSPSGAGGGRSSAYHRQHRVGLNARLRAACEHARPPRADASHRLPRGRCRVTEHAGLTRRGRRAQRTRGWNCQHLCGTGHARGPP